MDKNSSETGSVHELRIDDLAYESDNSLDGPPPYADGVPSLTSDNDDYPHEKSFPSSGQDSSLSNTATLNSVEDGHYSVYSPKIGRTSLIFIHEKSKRPVWFSEVSALTRPKPDVALHAIPSPVPPHANRHELIPHAKSGPILGTVGIPTWKRNLKVGLGETQGESFELVNPNKISIAEYRFTFRNVDFSWRRTRDPALGVEGKWTQRFTRDSYALFHTESGDPVAVFVERMFDAKEKTKRGSLRILKDLDSWSPSPPVGGSGSIISKIEVQTVIVVTVAGILEKARRNHGGGGGG